MDAGTTFSLLLLLTSHFLISNAHFILALVYLLHLHLLVIIWSMTVWLMIMSMVLKLTVSVLAAPNGGDIRKQFSYFESDRKMLVRIFFFFLNFTHFWFHSMRGCRCSL